MSRAEDLRSLLEFVEEEQRIVLEQLIEELIFIENKMAELKDYPFISVHPENPQKQKATVAAKQYKELAQSYMNGIRILSSAIRRESEGMEEDPVQKFLENYGR